MQKKLFIKTTLLFGIALFFGKHSNHGFSEGLNNNNLNLNDLVWDEEAIDKMAIQQVGWHRGAGETCPCEAGVCPATIGGCLPVATRRIYQAPGDAFSSPPVN